MFAIIINVIRSTFFLLIYRSSSRIVTTKKVAFVYRYDTRVMNPDEVKNCARKKFGMSSFAEKRSLSWIWWYLTWYIVSIANKMASKILLFLQLFGPRVPRVSCQFVGNFSNIVGSAVLMVKIFLIILFQDINRIKFMGNGMFMATLLQIWWGNRW